MPRNYEYDHEGYITDEYDDDEEVVVEDDQGAKFPHVHVKLVGEDGNAFAILGRVQRELRRGGATPEQVKEFFDEATSGDYNVVLATVMKWVTVE